MKFLAIFVLAACILSARFANAADLITVDARDTLIADVIRLIGAESNQNIVPDATVRDQRITFRLKAVTVEAALGTLAAAYNLQFHRAGNIILIGDAAAMNRRYASTTGPGSPQTQIFQLDRAKPEDVAAMLVAALPVGTVAVPDKRTATVIVTTTTDALQRAARLVNALDGPAAGTGSGAASEAFVLHNERPSDAVKQLKTAFPDSAMVADDRTNTVVVTGPNEVINATHRLLEGMDRPGRQVMFEVRVTDIRPNDDSSNVGVEFGGAGFGTGSQGSFPWQIVKSSVVVNAQINALVQLGKAQILATPRIATLNNHEASLLVGEQYPVVTVNQQTGFPSVQTIDVGVRLRLTPTIGDDGTITADLHPEYSQIIGFNSNFPILANRKVDSTLRIHDGETIVLGGLFEDTSSEDIVKVPWLSQIPILGPFFKNKSTSHERDEVVFFITPHIL
jgi:protein transport protein HofQ/type IV pilus assembly protein PilQ